MLRNKLCSLKPNLTIIVSHCGVPGINPGKVFNTLSELKHLAIGHWAPTVASSCDSIKATFICANTTFNPFYI